ncbi:MAG: DUF6088 family protein [Ignavibacteriaceae bacterium]
MLQSLEIQILNKIKKARRGTPFFIDSFSGIGNPRSVNKALERLVNSAKLVRIAPGMYLLPKQDKIIGQVLPGIDEIAVAIAKRDRARIVPTGSYAMYKLGLSTQIPLNIVFYTDASPRKIKIGNQIITFKKGSSKRLSAIGDLSKLAIQALRTIGKDNVKEEEVKKIQELLKKEKAFNLKHDFRIAPVWMRNLIFPSGKFYE